MRVYSPLRRLVPVGERRGRQGLRIVDFSGGGTSIRRWDAMFGMMELRGLANLEE